jgi:hypothetical protein
MIKKLPTRIEELKTEIQRFKEQMYPGKAAITEKRKVHFVPLEDCIRSSEKFLSMSYERVNCQCTDVVDATVASPAIVPVGPSMNITPDPDLDALLIQHWGIAAKSKIDDQEYEAAEVYLKRILARRQKRN